METGFGIFSASGPATRWESRERVTAGPALCPVGPSHTQGAKDEQAESIKRDRRRKKTPRGRVWEAGSSPRPDRKSVV